MKKCRICDFLIEQDICDFCGANNEIIPDVEAEAEKVEIIEEIKPEEVKTEEIPTESIATENLTEATEETVKPEPQETTTFVEKTPKIDKPKPSKQKNSAKPLIFGLCVLLVAVVVFVFSLIQERSNNDEPEQTGTTATETVATEPETETQAAATTDPENIILDSLLLGIWGGGHGTEPLVLFNEAYYLEFSEDGTLLIIQNGFGRSIEWIFENEGSFLADDQEFSYNIDGDALIIEDDSNNSWTFLRTQTLIDYTPTLSIAEIVGTWGWVNDPDFIYAFNADGTAVRGFEDLRFDFLWTITAENVIYMQMRSDDYSTERWQATLENGTLTITDLDSTAEWQYERTQNEFDISVTVTESALLGRWTSGHGASLLWFASAETIEFLEDGTVTHFLNGGVEENRYRIGTSQRFTTDGLAFAYQVTDNQLIITDLLGNSRTFSRD